VSLELTIDTASDVASVALSREGVLEVELTWRCPRNHSRELLPAVEYLMQRSGVDKGELTAVFVCIGPGSYTGLRVGIASAKGLAFALGLPIVGVGRLEADAYQHADFAGPICAVHRAGRGELAWAVYRNAPAGRRQVLAPRLTSPDELIASVRRPTLFCGEIEDELAARLRDSLGAKARFASPAASLRRAATIAELAWRRLAAGQADDATSLRPIYLREAVFARPPAPKP
jgi:tRNA threonylcarbamoyladenosine biosynthesis protein TsaB